MEFEFDAVYKMSGEGKQIWFENKFATIDFQCGWNYIFIAFGGSYAHLSLDFTIHCILWQLDLVL